MSIDILLTRIDEVRRRQRVVAVGAGVARTALAALALIFAFFLLDWLVLARSTPGSGDRLARAILVLAMLATFAWVVWRSVLTPLRRRADDDEVALKIEKGHPELRGRLISTVQLSRDGRSAAVSKELIDALEEDTVSFAGGLHFTDIIDLKTLKKIALIAGGFVALALALGAWRSDFAASLFARMALGERQYPTAAKILSVTEGQKVIRGEPFPIVIELDAAGVLPDTASVTTRAAAGRSSTLTMARAPFKAADAGSPVRYVGSIEHVLEDLEFRAGAHDALWPRWEKLIVLDRPAIKAMSLAYRFPDYLGRKAEASSVGDIRAPEGSTVRITASFNKTVAKARIQRRDNQQTLPPADLVLAADKLSASTELTIEKGGYYKLLLTCTDGFDNASPVEYVIEAVKDRAPTVKITFPSQDKTVTRFAKWPIRFSARDDWGIVRGRLKYRTTAVGQSGEQGGALEADPQLAKDAKSLDLAGLVKGAAQKEVGGEFFFDLKPLNVQPDTRITYWIEMDDARSPEPNHGVSQAYTFTVVDVAVMQEMLERDRNAVLETIQVIRDKQKDTRDGVDAIRRDLPATPPPAPEPGK
jgi:hypothetical protein